MHWWSGRRPPTTWRHNEPSMVNPCKRTITGPLPPESSYFIVPADSSTSGTAIPPLRSRTSSRCVSSWLGRALRIPISFGIDRGHCVAPFWHGNVLSYGRPERVTATAKADSNKQAGVYGLRSSGPFAGGRTDALREASQRAVDSAAQHGTQDAGARNAQAGGKGKQGPVLDRGRGHAG